MATPATAPASGRALIDAAPGRRAWLALVLLCLAQVMLVLDVTVVNVALPGIGAGLGLGRAGLTWVLTGYTVAFGGLMLLGGRLADLLGARRVLLAGLAAFTAASAVSGVAGTGAVLIGGRVAQGVGAALLSPSALALVTTTFTGPRRGKALGIWAAVGASGAALGVLLGGLLVSTAGWRWIFFINLPIGLIVAAALPPVLRSIPGGRDHADHADHAGNRPARRERLDVPGALTVVAATAALIYGLISAGSDGWLSAPALAPIGAAAVLYAAFGLLERTTRRPLLQVSLLTRRPVAAGAFLMLIGTGLLVGAFFLGSFYLQHVRGYSAVHTGLVFLPIAVTVALGAQAASHLATVLDRRALTAGALTVGAAGMAVAAQWHGPLALIVGLCIAAVGAGATLVSATTTALADAQPAEAGLRSGVISTFHELGSALGIAVLSSLAASSLAAPSLAAASHAAASHTAAAAAATAGFTRAFAACAVAALAAAVIAALAAPRGRAPAAAGHGPHGH